MDVQSEVSGSLKSYLLLLVLVLIGTMGYFVYQQNRDIGAIYAATDESALTSHHQLIPVSNVDSNDPVP